MSAELENSKKQRKSVFSQNKHNSRVAQSRIMSTDGPHNLIIPTNKQGETIGSMCSFNDTPQPNQLAA
jgi:hypothetical protein